jgi:hypothetical protein
MEENAAEKTRYNKDIRCPGCGEPLSLDLQLTRVEGELYMWFEGLCSDCLHKIVDPMTRRRAELSEEAWKILAN